MSVSASLSLSLSLFFFFFFFFFEQANYYLITNGILGATPFPSWAPAFTSNIVYQISFQTSDSPFPPNHSIILFSLKHQFFRLSPLPASAFHLPYPPPFLHPSSFHLYSDATILPKVSSQVKSHNHKSIIITHLHHQCCILVTY